MSQRIVSEQRYGKNQYATKLGSAAAPCIEYSGEACATISGICVRDIQTYLVFSTGGQKCLNVRGNGRTAMTPDWSAFVQREHPGLR